MTKSAHTPEPWHQDGLKIVAPGRGIIARALTPQEGGTFDCQANAAFIVTACNAHDEMVAALKEADAKLTKLIRDLALAVNAQGIAMLVKWQDEIRAAIAKATTPHGESTS